MESNAMTMKELQQQSYLFGSNAAFIEQLYSQFLRNESSVDERWRTWFRSLQNGSDVEDVDHLAIQSQIASLVQQKKSTTFLANTAQHQHELKQVKVLQLINSYRFKGHIKANLDPLGRLELGDEQDRKLLTIEEHNLSDDDLETIFNTGSMFGVNEIPLKDIIDRLETIYCGTIGSEYMYMSSVNQKRWIQQRLETTLATPSFKPGRRNRILDRIIAAENLEKFLHTRYVGQKRFSLEGGESLIPMLDRIIQQAGKNGSKEIVIGMAHRGRLNVLTNLLGKMPKDLFDEFEGKVELSDRYNYDVKYHQGFSSDVNTDGGPTHLGLAFNPSHLEIVDPVVEGSVRARQRKKTTLSYNSILPVLVHGDAAFAGQGVVMETFNMCNTRGYRTGGTIHIIVNNQIGFTTSNPKDVRSTMYCTDIARMVQAPIFHVNGDDPEACVFIAELALDFRKEFEKDVIIDMMCYRRYGHNEADEPAATQPQMYEAIRNHPRIVEKHSQNLIDQGVVTREQVDQMIADYRKALEQGGAVALNVISALQATESAHWHQFEHADINNQVNTGVEHKTLKKLGKKLLKLPKNFQLHNRVRKIMDSRQRMLDEDIQCDWGFAETLAYATLLNDNYAIRISGQDSERGTFFHRHAVLHNQDSGNVFIPLKKIKKNQPRFEVINSFLSEEAVLGFEYGYSTTTAHTLVIWEAQFGDFANGAQVVIDQFISSGEVKWGRMSNLVMLLPHGYEGQGPEHSSARLERYLQLCAQNNMRVVMPTMPAQIYHLLRSQMISGFRKPLIVMSPKSLLRHEAAVSPLKDLTEGTFQRVIEETDELNPEEVSRLILCTGKIYFKLHEVRNQKYNHQTAIVRVEQLYPYPAAEIEAVLQQYPNLKQVAWCQDEPRNQGAWSENKRQLNNSFNPMNVVYAGRSSSASSAVGYMALHLEQETRLVTDAFELNEE